MSELPPPHDPVEALGEAYELLLETAIEDARKAREKSGPALHRFIDLAREKLVTAKRLTDEESREIAAALKRDLRSAADHLQRSGGNLRKWLGGESGEATERLKALFLQAADQTTVELNELRGEAEQAGYHTGEIAGPGILVCDACGKQLHFDKAGRIPPCPGCKGTDFHRERA